MAQSLLMPLTVSPTGGFVTLEQGDDAELAQSVALLLASRPGERRSLPGYGLPDPLGSGIDPELVAATVVEWEDRADPVAVENAIMTAEQDLRVYPRRPADLQPFVEGTAAVDLVVGPRTSAGLGVDDQGRYFIDPDIDDQQQLALHSERSGLRDGDVLASAGPAGEPVAATVGLDDDARPYFEEIP